MFGFFFRRWRKASKCKKLLKQLQSRLKLLKNKKYSISRHLRHDIALFIRINDHTRALLRTQQLCLVENSISVYDLLLKFSDFILQNFSSIRKIREVISDDINEAVSSIVFASARCGELYELISIRELFGQRYGQLFVSKALQLLPGNLVNNEIIDKLSITSVSEDQKSKLLDEIAKESGLRLEILRLEYTSEVEKQVNGKEEEKKVMVSDSNSFSNDQTQEVYKFSVTDIEEEKIIEERYIEDDDYYIEEVQVGKDQRVFRFKESNEEERSLLSSSSSLRRFKDMECLKYYNTRKRINCGRRRRSRNCYHIVYNVYRVKNEEEEEELRRRRLLPKHVHPKLPDCDQIVAHFKALKTEQFKQCMHF